MSKNILFITIFLLLGMVSLEANCTPIGTAGDDTVNCTGTINAFQYFYGGNDTVTLNNVNSITYHNSYWLDESLGGNSATDGNDMFIARNSQFHWVLGFNGDDTFNIYNSQFNNAYGDTNPGHGVSQRGNDTFIIENSISYGYILGGNDNDTIRIKDSNVSNVSSGYSNIYPNTDYTPFDGDDLIILDHVNFTAPLYWDTTSVEGLVGAGKGNDTISFVNGGEAYYVYGGHGDDRIIIYDNTHFNACPNSSQNIDRCGIYGDEAYATEFNTTGIPILHGDDFISLHNGDYTNILIQGGDGSDLLSIDTLAILTDTLLDGGDDRKKGDTFIDQLTLNKWSGNLKGSNLINWETIILNHTSIISFTDKTIVTGYENGISASTGYPYGLIVTRGSILTQSHDFLVDGNLHNNATINLQDNTITTLTVKNSYTASNGNLYIDTLLNGNSPGTSDILHIQGDSSGITQLHINNIAGIGGETGTGDTDGILVVKVEGVSNGIFTLDSSPIIVGNYIYKLHKASNGNWYLQSEKIDYKILLSKNVAENSIRVVQEGNIVNSVIPKSLHYTFYISNHGNMPLSSISLTDTLPNHTSKIPRYISGDTNQNEILDINEIWKYTLTYNLKVEELKGKESLINHATVSTHENTTSSDSAVTNISLLVIDPTPTPTVTPTPTAAPTPNPKPQYISNLEANGATIHWIDYSNNELGYKIYLGNILIAIVSKNSTSYQLLNLESNTHYTYTILPYNGSGTGKKQVVDFQTKLGYGWLVSIYNLIL